MTAFSRSSTRPRCCPWPVALLSTLPATLGRQLNPLAHFMVIMRGVFLRDMPFWLVAERIWPMAAIAVVTITAAAWLFRHKIQ